MGKSFSLSSELTGRASRIAWFFGDGTYFTNTSASSISHTWTNLGNFTVTLTAYNNDYPAGVSTNVVIPVEPLAQPTLSIVGASLGNRLTINFQGQYGRIYYTVQETTNLTPPSVWLTVATVFGFGGPEQATDIACLPTKTAFTASGCIDLRKSNTLTTETKLIPSSQGTAGQDF